MFKQIHKISPFRASKKNVIPQKLAPTNTGEYRTVIFILCIFQNTFWGSYDKF